MRRMSLYIVGDAGACKQVERRDSASRVQLSPRVCVLVCTPPALPAPTTRLTAVRLSIEIFDLDTPYDVFRFDILVVMCVWERVARLFR